MASSDKGSSQGGSDRGSMASDKSGISAGGEQTEALKDTGFNALVRTGTSMDTTWLIAGARSTDLIKSLRAACCRMLCLEQSTRCARAASRMTGAML